MAMPNPTPTRTGATNQGVKRSYMFPFILVTSLFFFWGFIHNMESSLIPHLKNAFSLNTLKALLVDSAVYLGYFIMAIPAGIIMKKYGYKTGILIGLFLFSTGCFLFIPAANTMLYLFFLGALFIVACGLAILETAANPYVTVLGAPETATQRLNFAQSFNGLAAFLAPIIGRNFILSKSPMDANALAALDEGARKAYLLQETASVKMPYTVLGTAILIVFAVFLFTKLPDVRDDDEKSEGGFFHALRHKQLAWGVVAQFFYVGAQVCIISSMILFAASTAAISQKEATGYASIAGLAFMLGRFVGTFFMRFVAPPKLLAIYSLICILLCLVVIAGPGISALYSAIGITFFMSIMFPTIFALSIQDIGSDTKAGSSLLIMSIVGGAILPLGLGYITDVTHHIQYGYAVPLICFAFVLYFAVSGHKHTEKAVEVLH